MYTIVCFIKFAFLQTYINSGNVVRFAANRHDPVPEAAIAVYSPKGPALMEATVAP